MPPLVGGHNKSSGVLSVGLGSEIFTDSFMSYCLMISVSKKSDMHDQGMSEELFFDFKISSQFSVSMSFETQSRSLNF